MRKWEYLLIDVAYMSPKGGQYAWFANDSGTWKDPPLLSAYLNQVGEEGWELECTIGSSAGSLVFKRPKETK